MKTKSHKFQNESQRTFSKIFYVPSIISSEGGYHLWRPRATFTPVYGRYVNVNNLADNTTLLIKTQRRQPKPPTEATNCSLYRPAVPSAIVSINYDTIDTIEARRYRKRCIYQPKNDYTNRHHPPLSLSLSTGYPISYCSYRQLDCWRNPVTAVSTTPYTSSNAHHFSNHIANQHCYW